MAARGLSRPHRASVRPRPAGRTKRRPRTLGQSLAEFALVLPILLLLTLVGIDFGRIYLGYINLQNMARIAANFAANNPNAWLTNSAANLATRTKYQSQIVADAAATNCVLTPSTPASPTFTDSNADGISTGIGDRASVAFTCQFHVITPVISAIVGGTVNVSASAVFPVKSAISATSNGGASCTPPTAAINAVPTSGLAPLNVTFADASGGGPGTAWSWNFGDSSTSSARDPGVHQYTAPGTYVVTLKVDNLCASSTTSPGTTIFVSSASPALCTVPGFVTNHTKINSAQGIWSTAGFTTTVQEQSGHSNGNYTITSQSIVGASSAPCNSSITVNG
jgi:PKD repeat protein